MINNNFEPEVLYCDEYFAIVYKAPGFICEYTEKEDSLPLFYKSIFEKTLHKKLSFIQCPHRLDKPVSGLVIVAFTKEIFSFFQKTITTSNDFSKMYLAICEGKWEISKDFLLLTHYLFFDKKRQKSFCSLEYKNSYKKSELRYRCFGTGERYSYFLIHLLTGRTHQIRSQLSFEKLFIKGDVKYGAKRTDPLNCIRLHAYLLEFIHPVTGEKLTFSQFPQQKDALWTDLITQWEKYNNEEK